MLEHIIFSFDDLLHISLHNGIILVDQAKFSYCEQLQAMLRIFFEEILGEHTTKKGDNAFHTPAPIAFNTSKDRYGHANFACLLCD